MKPLIVANWKMNPSTLAQAGQIFNSVKKEMRNIKNVEVVICPPFPFILNLKSKIHAPYRNRVSGAGLNLKLGAQDVFWEESGAYTGEISPLMLKDIGCGYVIVGHSERRLAFAETDEMVNKKLKAVLSAGLIPILCIGESQKERAQGKTTNVIKKQLTGALKNLSKFIIHNSEFILAYEPIWAIGTGEACGPEEAGRACLFLRETLKRFYGVPAKNIALLYGGSVNSSNAARFIKEAGFQGVLVGSASLDEGEFVKIVKAVSRS